MQILYGCTYLLKVIKIIGTESTMVVARVWGAGGGKGELPFLGGRVSVYKMKRAVEMDDVMMVALEQQCECAHYRRRVYLKMVSW